LQISNRKFMIGK